MIIIYKIKSLLTAAWSSPNAKCNTSTAMHTSSLVLAIDICSTRKSQASMKNEILQKLHKHDDN